MDPIVAVLVIGSAVLHPLREVYIKDNAYPEGLAYAVPAMFALLSGVHVAATGADPWAAFEVWPLVVASGVGVILYFVLSVMCVKLGDVSVYYPIMRSSPFVVVVATLARGTHPLIAPHRHRLVLVSALLLQYERGVRAFRQLGGRWPCGWSPVCAAWGSDSGRREAMQSLRPGAGYGLVMHTLVCCGDGVVLVATRPSGPGGARAPVRGGGRATPWRILVGGGLSRIFPTTCCWRLPSGRNVAAVRRCVRISIPVIRAPGASGCSGSGGCSVDFGGPPCWPFGSAVLVGR